MKFLRMLTNYWKDFFLYVRFSNVFWEKESLEKIEAKIILHYHAIEKGFLHEKLKLGFGRERILKLHTYLALDLIRDNRDRSQIFAAYQIICKYYEVHEANNFKISDYYTETQYNSYSDLLGDKFDRNYRGVIEYQRDNFYLKNQESFDEFSESRKSIRTFNGELVDHKLIEKAVKLALNAPSVCNRQATRVYLLEDSEKIKAALRIQGGFSHFLDDVKQLLIVTNDRKYYYTIGERNQFYIDGGIFLMNLLYSLHFYQIACCPANWGKEISHERRLSQFVSIPESEKIICMIPIGIATDRFRVTLSKRRTVDEVIRHLN